MKQMILVASVLLLACGCGEECIYLPCAPSGPAVVITVTTTQDTNPFSAGLTATVISGPQRGVFCDSGGECDIFGGRGDYTIRVSATGYASQEVKVTVTGQDAGCNKCERVDTQRVPVVLAPAM